VHADVVLPATGRQERAGTATNWEGRAQRFAHAVDGPDLVMDDWEIVVQLAALLGHDLGVDDLDGIRAEIERLGAARPPPHDLPTRPTATSEAPGPRRRRRSPMTPATGSGLVGAIRPLLLDRGTMLTGADDLQRDRPAGDRATSVPPRPSELGVDRRGTGRVPGERRRRRARAAGRDPRTSRGVVVVPPTRPTPSAFALADREGGSTVELVRGRRAGAAHGGNPRWPEEVA
jgi:hypothetical protein